MGQWRGQKRGKRWGIPDICNNRHMGLYDDLVPATLYGGGAEEDPMASSLS